MKKRKPLLFLSFFLFLLLFHPYSSWSQLVLGQYEDEAPFRTWNTFGIQTASSLAMGDTHFSSASDCSVALFNPALLLELPKISFTLNSSFNQASFFKYSVVNTGHLTSNENVEHNFYTFDFAGISFRLKNWAFALSWAQVERYDRPLTETENYWRGSLYYTFDLNQGGSLKNINLSIARKISNRLSAGLGFNYVYGNLKRDIIEEWILDGVTITDNKSHEFRGFYLNGGISLELSEKLKVAAVFRTPFVKKSDSHSLLRYYAPGGETDIKIEDRSDDEYKLPLVVGLGVRYEISENLKVVSDLAFFNWSKYSVDYFEEELRRDFKDVIKIGVGLEQVASLRFLNQDFLIPLRIGFSYDPQPMKEPNSRYVYYSFGSGLHWKALFLDVSALIGQERGSGDSLKARKMAVSLSFKY